MRKKVLVISASARKGGNSDTLCDQFISGATEVGHTVEKVFLGDKKINFCTGCYACSNGADCMHKDDVAEILEQMMDADVILMATPVYFYTMNGQLKTLIDRTVPKYMKLRNKDMYFIATAAETDKSAMQPTIAGFRGFMDCYDNLTEKAILIATGVWQVGAVNNTLYMQQAYEMGKSI